MTFWHNIVKLAAGRVNAADRDDCQRALPGQDPAFSTAVIALGAKLAKADGRADLMEFEAFSEVFQPTTENVRDIQRLYDLARQTTLGFESYAKRLAKRYLACPQLLEDVLDGLFHIAKSDGVVTYHELDYLEEVSRLFGLSALTFRRIRATHLGAGPKDPYVILAVEADASDETVRSAWLRALSEAHPDRALSRGLPAEFVELAHLKSAAINEAYDKVMRERRAMVEA